VAELGKLDYLEEKINADQHIEWMNMLIVSRRHQSIHLAVFRSTQNTEKHYICCADEPEKMIKLEPFRPSDFHELISWIDSPELLITIAGTDLIYPLTEDQLLKYLEIPNSIPFRLLNSEGKCVGHAELIRSSRDSCKIDKLLIGDNAHRGNGTGTLVVKALLSYAFLELHVDVVELNVFDWNVAAIRCYTKAGFTVNELKKKTFEVKGNSWVAINMTLSRERWLVSSL
jgi:RimJ/RimL family protein N-acetyltransferase